MLAFRTRNWGFSLRNTAIELWVSQVSIDDYGPVHGFIQGPGTNWPLEERLRDAEQNPVVWTSHKPCLCGRPGTQVQLQALYLEPALECLLHVCVHHTGEPPPEQNLAE